MFGIVYLADSGEDGLVLILFVAVVILAYKYSKLSGIHKKNQKELMAKVISQTEHISKLEIDSTRFQLNPHAFKNTLSTVKLFAERTTESIDKLSGVLDYMVYVSSAPFVSLTQEIQFLEAFLDLYKLNLVRKDIVNFQVRIDPQHTFWHVPVVPPMITAYFIENAFKHGRLEEKGSLDVRIELIDNRLTYKVANPIARVKMSGPGGVGYTNMKRRLDVVFPHRHTLRTEPEGDQFVAQLEIGLQIQYEKN